MTIKVLKAKPEFVDERGYISRVIDEKIFPLRAVLQISSKKGTVRANHYHKKDSHWAYCISGKFRYSEKDMRKKNVKIQSVIIHPGEAVLSKPMYAHSMEFLEDTVFLALTSEPRFQKAYEKDLVRIKLV